jgi:WD40 repeat protein
MKHVLSCCLLHLLQVWDLKTGQRLRSQAVHKGMVTCLAYASSVKLLFSGSIDGSIGVWTDKGSLLQVCPTGSLQQQCLASTGARTSPQGVNRVICSGSGWERSNGSCSCIALVVALEVATRNRGNMLVVLCLLLPCSCRWSPQGGQCSAWPGAASIASWWQAATA